MSIQQGNEREIFVSALQMASDEQRRAYLEEVCAGRPDLWSRVQALLEANNVQDGFLNTPVLDSQITVDSSALTEGPGTVIGRYKLLETIGEGGMAVVYMAEQLRPVHRRVALKVIKLGMDTRGVIARFEAERQTLALMDHPNIAKVFDGGATETGRPYFVMELVRGVPITEYCDKNKLNTRERLDLFIQVCQAVQHAHQKGIIHRDIKPSNILVTLHDGVPVPKVIDFGVAKATEQRLTDKTLFTRFQAFIGTPAYMSPEQAEMSGLDIDTRTDIYALGVLLYELLTGKTPFDAEELLRTGLDACRRTIREKEPVRPSTRVATMIGPELSDTAERRRTESMRLVHVLRADLDWIVMKCLEKDRTRRYDTANALGTDLHRYLTGEPVLARPPSTIYRTGKFVRRNKAVVAVAAVLVIAAVVSSWQAVRATRAEREQIRLAGIAREALENEAGQRRRAEAEELAALRRAYNSDMNLVQQALRANNFGRVVSLLDRYRPTAGEPDFRQWEWRYFWAQSRSEAAFALPRQPDAINALSIAPNGRILATSDRRGTLKLWDLNRRAEIATIEQRGFGARAFAFSRDGGRLAAVIREDRRHAKIAVWTVAEREIAEEFPVGDRVEALAFSPDDTRLLILNGDMSVEAWDFGRRKLEALLPEAEERGHFRSEAIFSPDVRRVAVSEGGQIRVLDLATGAELARMQAFEQNVAAMAFSPDGTTLAASPLFTDVSTTIKLFSTASGQEVGRLVGHVSWVPGLTFTADGERLISVGADQTLRVWDLANQVELDRLHGHLSEVYCVDVTPDGETIVSGCKDGTLLGWHTEGVERRKEFESLPVAVSHVAFLPDGEGILSVNEDGTVQLWDSETLSEIECIPGLGDDVRRLLVSPDGALVFAGTRSGEIRVLDWATRLVITTLSLGSGRHSGVAPIGLIDGGRTLVVSGAGSTAHLLDTDSWQSKGEWDMEDGRHWFRSEPILSPDGRSLVIAGRAGPMQFLDLAGGQIQEVPLVQDWGATDTAFSPEGQLLATSSGEGTVHLWDTGSLEVVDVLRGHLLGVHGVTFSPDGQRLASSSHGDEAIKLWDVSTRHEVATLTGEGLITDRLQFSPDGRMLLAVNAKGKAQIWRAPPLPEIAAAEAASGGRSATATSEGL